MPQNIKINNVRSLDAKVLLDEYYDFMLYKGEAYGVFDPSECLAADFSDLTPAENGKLYSKVSWTGATNTEDVILQDIGFTGIDNGFITYRKDRISNQDFMNILTGSTYEISSADTRFFMSPISGNTLDYIYPMETVKDESGKTEYVAFNGGFYQGFYKLFGFDYQTLPTSLEYGWTLNFKIRPRSDYEVHPGTINEKHPENNGLFFFMGARAENKFWEYYPNNSASVEEFIAKTADDEGYMGNDCDEGEIYDIYHNSVADSEYLQDELPEEPEPGYFLDGYALSAVTPDCPCIEDIIRKQQEDCDYSYFADNYRSYIGEAFVDIIAYEGDYASKTTPYMDCVKEAECKCGCDCNCDKKKPCPPKRKKSYCECGDGEDAERDYPYFPSWYMGAYNYHPEGPCEICGMPSPCPPTPSGCTAEGNNYAEVCKCCEDYFIDCYYNDMCYNGPKAIEPDFLMDDIRIDKTGSDLTDSIGHLFNRTGYFSIKTDNKFVFFNRTCTGFTTHNWTEGAIVELTGRTNWSNVNLFLLMNRTCTGWTTHTIQKYYEANEKPYDIYKDIKNNAFGLRITPSGAIGYKYGILDCETEDPHHYSVVEEYSKDGMVKYDEWNDITVRIAVLNPGLPLKRTYLTNSFYSGIGVTVCDAPTIPHRMKIYVYVNGYLKLVSKELPEFSFRALDEVFQKQEGVPFNISLGGGTQGLMETIGPDYMNSTKYILPMERDFGGSFNGDIKSFKMFDCLLNYSTIRDYLSKNN